MLKNLHRSRFIYEGSKSNNFDDTDHFATSVQSKRDRKNAPREKTELNAEELKKCVAEDQESLA